MFHTDNGLEINLHSMTSDFQRQLSVLVSKIILSPQHNFSFQIHETLWNDTQLCSVFGVKHKRGTFSKLSLIAEL